MVMTQAVMTLPATCQRTADARRAAPAPMMQPVIVCVVDTGIPIHDAVNNMNDPPSEALKPWCWDSFVMRVPMVSMIFQPPHKVPRPIAT